MLNWLRQLSGYTKSLLIAAGVLVLGALVLHFTDISFWELAAFIISAFVFGAFTRFLFLLKETMGGEYEVRNEECRRLFNDRDSSMVSQLIFYGYVATFVTLGVAILPPIVFSNSESLTAYGRGSAVGMLIGCQATTTGLAVSCPTDANGKTVLKGEWVLNIGGRVELKEIPTWKVAATRIADALDKAAACKSEAEIESKTTSNTASSQAANATGKSCSEALKETRSNARKLVQQELANEQREAEVANAHAIHGGAVVPLYMIVISLLGAAVGLARRLPEYQRRGSPMFVDTYITRQKNGQVTDEDIKPMDATQVREAVVFQVMQVFSAPLVAITAYYIVAPEAIGNVVLIAFASGFSTEAVLMVIRKGVDRLGKGESRPDPMMIPEVSDDAAKAASGTTQSVRPTLPQRRKIASEAAAAAAAKAPNNQ